MQPEQLQQYIKDLTTNDKKTLTQKVAKLFEEGGELAKIVLPYEGAYTTNHRVVDKRRLLEEVADVYLVNQSILYSLGFTDDEFEQMVFEKAQIWNTLQVKEDRALAKCEKMPYEIHITINAEQGIDIPTFRKHCAEIGGKPIVLDLPGLPESPVLQGGVIHEQMYEDFESHLDFIKHSLNSYGFDLEKEIVEFSIYDTKTSHDKKWLEA